MDQHLRDLERRAGTDVESNLRFQLAQIKTNQWVYPAYRYDKDIENIKNYLSDNLPEWSLTDFSIVMEQTDVNKEESIINYGFRIFTSKDVNEANSHINSNFLICGDLMYPTKKGVLEFNIAEESYLVRSVVPEHWHPCFELTAKIVSVIDTYLQSTNKTKLTYQQQREFSNNVKLKTAFCDNCGNLISWNREHATMPWVQPAGWELSDYSGQTSKEDLYDCSTTGHKFMDPLTGVDTFECVACRWGPSNT